VTNDNEEIFVRGSWCYLRAIRVSDAGMTFEWRNLDRASSLGGASTDVEGQVEWISARPKSELNFIICLASNDIPVGMISIIDINHHHGTAQTARFLIGEEKMVAGLPIAVEAMYLCYEKIFLDWNMRKVWGFVASTNWRMIKWQTFLGMKKEGVQEQQLIVGGEIVDAVLLGLTREQYLGNVQNKIQTMIRLMERKR
jgi:RimJ/RimL family protein N-acetyltransferase